MNNNLFIVRAGWMRDEVLDDLRVKLEGEYFFDRYCTDALLAERCGHFGFATRVPEKNTRWRMLSGILCCSYVYFPSGWHDDAVCRFAFAVAELLGREIIFGEDWKWR